MTPVIWRLLENKHLITVIFLSKFDYANDYRIQFLSNYDDFSIYNRDVFLGVARLNLLRLRRKIFFNQRFLKFYNTQSGSFVFSMIQSYLWPSYIIKNFSLLVQEWGGGFRVNFSEAQFYDVPTVDLPHGQNVFLNLDVNKDLIDFKRNTGQWPDFTNRNVVNRYVSNTSQHRKASIEFGLQPNKIESWGSARFCPQWTKKNLTLCKNFSSSSKSEKKKRIVFFMPHWNYNVLVDKVFSLLIRLSEMPNVYLVVKGHTRGNGRFPDEEWEKKINSYPNVEVNVSAHSPSLIAWADMVINFGSSIGIEAIIQNTPLIHALYLHTNQTVYDDSEVCLTMNSEEDIVSFVSDFNEADNNLPTDFAIERFFRTQIYSGALPYDVLELYSDKLTGIAKKVN